MIPARPAQAEIARAAARNAALSGPPTPGGVGAMPVVVVGALKLVLNNHGGTGVILGDQVHAERADGLLALDIGEVQIDDLVRTSTFSPSAIATSADEALCRRLAELLEANP